MSAIKTISGGHTHPDGLLIGIAGEKVAFFGAAPAVQPAHADQAAVGAGVANSGDATTDTVINQTRTLLNRIRVDLVALGLIKGAA